MRRSPSSVLSALGLSPAEEQLYQRVEAVAGNDVATVSDALLLGPGELRQRLAELMSLGFVSIDDDRVEVVPVPEALSALIVRQSAAAAAAAIRLDGLAQAVPFLVAAEAEPGAGGVQDIQPLDGEVSTGGDPLSLLTSLVHNSRGDLLWLRPDTWRMPRESAMAKVIGEAVASGRRSRAIYPVRALQQAPEALVARAEAGEQIRVLAELPTRMIVLGSTLAVLPEPLGYTDEPRVIVRQRAVVESLRLLFELMWERAGPVPSLDRGEARPDLRRMLLQQLARGAKDEQIARTLGISLRTVRRRVADLLNDLGVDTRFQAGVEAARRGWL